MNRDARSHTPQLRSARTTWVLLIYFGVAVRSLAMAQPDAFPKELDGYVAAAIKEWNIPGAALAIVKNQIDAARVTLPAPAS